MNIDRLNKVIVNSVLDSDGIPVCPGDTVIYCKGKDRIHNMGFRCMKGIVEKINPVKKKIFVGGKWMWSESCFSFNKYVSDYEMRDNLDKVEQKELKEKEILKNRAKERIATKIAILFMQSGETAWLEFFCIDSMPGKPLSRSVIEEQLNNKINSVKAEYDHIYSFHIDSISSRGDLNGTEKFVEVNSVKDVMLFNKREVTGMYNLDENFMKQQLIYGKKAIDYLNKNFKVIYDTFLYREQEKENFLYNIKKYSESNSLHFFTDRNGMIINRIYNIFYSIGKLKGNTWINTYSGSSFFTFSQILDMKTVEIFKAGLLL